MAAPSSPSIEPYPHALLSGEYDLGNAPELEQLLCVAALRTDGDLVVDCSHVAFLDSTALAVFVRTERSLAEEGRALRLVNVPRDRYRVFDVTGLDHLIASTTID